MRSLRVAAIAAMSCLCVNGQFGVPPAPDVLLVAQFRTPLSAAQTLARLDEYYQEQVSRKIASALPEIAPGAYYETWHDIWVWFAPDGGGLKVTMKRPADAGTVLLAKGWMLEIAGRCGGDLPLHYVELPALRQVESETYGSRRDVARALSALPSYQPIETWQHAGLVVSAAPLGRITLEPAALHGVRKVTVTAETAAAARELAGRIKSAMSGPCVCAAYSETAEIGETLRRDAAGKAEDVNATTAQRIYLSTMDPKQIEAGLRADPETQKRLAAAAGWAGVKYRVDRAYPKVEIRWAELQGYSREDGRFEAERPLGATSAVNVRPPGQSGALLTARTKVGALAPGAYRITVEGWTADGESVRVDRRDFWFDGRVFEER